MVIPMETITLIDESRKTIEASLLLTYYSEEYNKNYLIYLIDNDLIASSYSKKNNNYIINNDLTDKEFDMLDKLIETKLGEIDV